MTVFMLDTNIVSYLIKGSFPALRKHVERIKMERVVISAITEAELSYGLALRPEAVHLKILVDEFLSRVLTLPWNSGAAQSYGRLRARLENEGKPMGNLDMMIAAHAIDVGATLVTNDQAFARIAHLKLADWTQA